MQSSRYLFKRNFLKVAVVAVLLAGLAVAVFKYAARDELTDEEFAWIIYRWWESDHRDFEERHGLAEEFDGMDVWFQEFSTGLIVYNNEGEHEFFLFYPKTKTFRKIPEPPLKRLTDYDPPVINENFTTALEAIPAEKREKYRKLVEERTKYGRLGIISGNAAVYFDEQLLDEFGSPKINERRYRTVLYAKGKKYDMFVGLPFGEMPVAESDRGTSRRVFILHKDTNRFDEHQVIPRNHEMSFDWPMKGVQFYRKYSPRVWFLPLSALGGLVVTYAFAIAALLLLARQRGSTVFSRTLLISIATKPLLVVPGLTRRLLFLGYGKRLRALDVVEQSSREYFGLPGEDSTGRIPWDLTGEKLHDRIADALGSQKPLLLVGKGGAGKSTVLRRLTYLAIEKRLPPSLRGFVPVLISASEYENTLTKAIADTLRGRDGVAVNDEIVKAQFQTGKFLILFDGVSEVITPKLQSLEEILKTAHHADYRNCRFVISTRPLGPVSRDVATLTLRPLAFEVIPKLLDHWELDVARRNQVLRQLQLFDKKPIDPLLLAMIIKESGEKDVSDTRSQVYERYFRALLRVRNNDDLWSGWQKALQTIALYTFLNTGKRGVGLPHEQLMKLLGEKENLSEKLNRLYRLPIADELDLLHQLLAADLLQRGRGGRWLFTHDTFEEFFAASYIVSYVDSNNSWPAINITKDAPEPEQSFVYVLEFVREMVDETFVDRLMRMDLPQRWKAYLTECEQSRAT